jgi:hypothetical protein
MLNIRDILTIVVEVLWGQATQQVSGHPHDAFPAGHPQRNLLDRFEHEALHEYLVGLGVEHQSRAHIALMAGTANALEHVGSLLGVLAWMCWRTPSMTMGHLLVNISINTAAQILANLLMLIHYA